MLLHCRVSLLLLGLRIHTLRHRVSWGDTCLRVAGGTAAPLELCKGTEQRRQSPCLRLACTRPRPQCPGVPGSAGVLLDRWVCLHTPVTLTQHVPPRNRKGQCLSSDTRPQVSTDSRDPGRGGPWPTGVLLPKSEVSYQVGVGPQSRSGPASWK